MVYCIIRRGGIVSCFLFSILHEEALFNIWPCFYKTGRALEKYGEVDGFVPGPTKPQ